MKDKGFTLIEVIVAGGIIAIGMLALTPLLISSYRIDTQTSYRVRAQYSVTQTLDNLISQSSLVCDGVTSTDFINAQTGQVVASATAAPVVITRTWTIGVPAALSNLCQITVTATYTDQGGTKTITSVSQKGK